MASSFTVVDVETANGSRASICQIGIAVFEDGKLTALHQSLVNPQEDFHRGNIRVHGIATKDVNKAPTYPQIADQIRALLEGQTIVTYTAFDQDALRKVHQKYGIPFFHAKWVDAHAVIKDSLRGHDIGSLSLTNVAKKMGVEYLAHNAAEDARATGEIILKVNELADSDIDDRLKKYRESTLHLAPALVTTSTPQPAQMHKKRGSGCLKMAAIALGIIVVLVVLAALCSQAGEPIFLQ